MELKNEVCSLESAIKLEKLGVPQKSLFYWSSTKGKNDFDCYYQNDQGDLDEQVCGPLDTYSAFTVAELGEMLPDDIHTYKQTYTGGLNVDAGTYWFSTYKTPKHDLMQFEKSEAEARAKILIYLLENKLI